MKILNKYKILITSSGDKHALINSVYQNTQNLNIELVLGDLSPNVSSRYYGYDFVQLPKIPNKFEVIFKFLKKYNINIVIPTREQELIFWTKFNDLYNREIKVIISPLESLNVATNKFNFYKKLKKEKYSTIDTYKDYKDIVDENIIVKENTSSSNQKTIRLLNSNDNSSIIKLFNDPIFQPFISGKEFSVDAFASFNSEKVFVVPRYRSHINNSESYVTKTFRSNQIENEAIEIIKLLGLKGPVMLQGIIQENDNHLWMECNPRFGGASNCGVEMGLDVWKWSILEKHDPLYIPNFIQKYESLIMFKSTVDNIIEE